MNTTSALALMHGEQAPAWDIAVERPEHRVILYLVAKCYSTSQIAVATGYSKAMILNLRKQSWFKRRLAELMHEVGGDQVSQFLQIHATDALEKIVDLMHGAQDERVQASCAKMLVDKIVPDKLDIQRRQNLPPAQLDEQIRVLEAQIEEISGESKTTEEDRSNGASTPGSQDSAAGSEAEEAGMAEETQDILLPA